MKSIKLQNLAADSPNNKFQGHITTDSKKKKKNKINQEHTGFKTSLGFIIPHIKSTTQIGTSVSTAKEWLSGAIPIYKS